MNFSAGFDAERTVWVALGIVIAAIIATALLDYLGTLLFAIFLYYATRPLYRRLDEHVDHPNVTTTVTLLAVVLPLLAVVGYAGLVGFQQLNDFLVTHSLEGYRQYLQPYLGLARESRFERLWNTLVTDPGATISPPVRELLRQSLGPVATVADLVFTVLARMFLMSVFLFYLLRDDRKLSSWFYRSVGHDDRVVEYTSRVDDDLETVFFSNLAILAINGALATATYLALNFVAPGGTVVVLPILLGMLTGAATLVPIVGIKLVYVPYTVYLLAMALLGQVPIWYPIAFFAVAFVVVDAIPDFFVRSYLSAQSGVHMGLVLLGYVLGTMAFGWAGLFLGPLVVVLAVHFAHAVFPELATDVVFS